MPACSEGQTVAVRAGRIITMAGDPIENGIIVIRDGRIASVAPGGEAPDGARVIDASGCVVIPGLVDANGRYGIRGDWNEESAEITPGFRIGPAVDDASEDMKRAAQLGITTVRVSPGNQNVIGGEGVILKTAGGSLGAQLVGVSHELKVVLADDPARGNQVPWRGRPDSFYFRQPTTRMGVVWLLRQALFKARTAPAGGAAESDDALAQALAGDLTVCVLVRMAVDIETTLKVAEEFGLTRLVFEECTEGYKMADEIAARGIPVILGPLSADPRRDRWRRYRGLPEASLNCAGILAAAGAKVAIASNSPGGPTSLLSAATMAVRNGMREDDALRAITVNPSEILGIAGRVGTIEVGKDADLVILSGPPMQFTTRIATVLVNGRVVFDAQMGADADE